MDETLKEMETELASLKEELIDICNDIKVCETKEQREELFEDKKLTQLDIEEVTSEIARYKELLAQKESENNAETDTENEQGFEVENDKYSEDDSKIPSENEEEEDDTETVETEEA
jgi:hypothetical protein